MTNQLKLLFALLLLAQATASAQTAVITLEMPPSGDGYNALQTGAAFAGGPASLYYNPATLSELNRSTETHFQFSNSYQPLLPVFKLDDLYQQFWGVSGTVPNESGFDFGVGFFQNHVNFGDNLTGTSDSSSLRFNSGEDVYALGTSLRLGVPINIGATTKFFDSRLSQGYDSLGNWMDGRARGWAFDFGILVSPHFHRPAGWDVPYFEFIPSAAVVWQNLGPDAYYISPDQSDPIPQYLRVSVGGEFRLVDLISLTVGEDREYPTDRRNRNTAPVITKGVSMNVLCFRFGSASLEDLDGGRNERSSSVALELNMLQIRRILKRTETGTTGDSKTPSKDLLKDPSRKINPRFTFGVHEIHSRDDGIRQGQKSIYLGISI